MRSSLDGLPEEESDEGLVIGEGSDPELVAWADNVKRNIPHVGDGSWQGSRIASIWEILNDENGAHS